MTTSNDPRYRMTMSLNVLNHLGIGLYSNVPAVLSEAIANAWDADAKRVYIDIDPRNRRIRIQDDGHGMTVHDANSKYLNVGYARREAGEAQTPNGRRVMGRKGIGKLSLFSIANQVEVHSVKDGQKHGFRMTVDGIKTAMAGHQDSAYYPASISEDNISITSGTLIVLSDVKRRLHQTGSALRRRLARRFSISGAEQNFTMYLNQTPITVRDREYQHKLQYIWTFGQKGERFAAIARNAKLMRQLVSTVELPDTEYEIDGWIGTANKPGDLKERDTGESINGIVIMCRDKLAQENILDEIGDEDIYSEYVIGEIHADFLDIDDQEDIATSSRQRIIEEDPRYQSLKSTITEALNMVQSDWRDQRNQDGRRAATMIPQVQEWYDTLNPDQRQNAGRLLGRINQLPVADETEKRRIFIGAILAFESLRFRNMLSRLDAMSPGNLGALADVFEQLDDLEQSAYYQITRDRVDVIRKLTELVDADVRERALQEHLYQNLWLLDPSWERATHTARMETRIYSALNGVYSDLSDDVKASRLDLYYTTSGNKHVIIELKRSGRILRYAELADQIERYHRAAMESLDSMQIGHQPLEIVCVLGNLPREWTVSSDGGQRYRDSIAAFNARVVMYDELINNALQSYQDYIDRSSEASRVYNLVRSIEDEDIRAMHPTTAEDRE